MAPFLRFSTACGLVLTESSLLAFLKLYRTGFRVPYHEDEESNLQNYIVASIWKSKVAIWSFIIDVICCEEFNKQGLKICLVSSSNDCLTKVKGESYLLRIIKSILLPIFNDCNEEFNICAQVFLIDFRFLINVDILNYGDGTSKKLILISSTENFLLWFNFFNFAEIRILLEEILFITFCSFSTRRSQSESDTWSIFVKQIKAQGLHVLVVLKQLIKNEHLILINSVSIFILTH